MPKIASSSSECRHRRAIILKAGILRFVAVLPFPTVNVFFCRHEDIVSPAKRRLSARIQDSSTTSDIKSKYPVIQSAAQLKNYHSCFDRLYPKYKALNEQLTSTSKMFSDLGARFEKYKHISFSFCLCLYV